MSGQPFPAGMDTLDRVLLRLVYAYHGYGILLYVLISCAIAAVLASCIGLERQLRGDVAGVRTHALLAVGSSLLMTISIWAIRMADGSLDIIQGTVDTSLNYDTSRIAAGVVTGIGFLGGGVIIKDKFTVRGLSTAATLWICTAIGLACGAGFILGAVIATVIVLLTLFLLSRITRRMDGRSPSVVICSAPGYPVVERVRTLCEHSGLALKGVKIEQVSDTQTVATARFLFTTDAPMLQYLADQLAQDPAVRSATPRYRKQKRRDASTTT